MLWRCMTYKQIGTDLMYRILAVRQTVFVVEQDCPYQDADGLDQIAWHLLAEDKQQQIAAYLRILPPGISYTEPSLGRVLTSADYRTHGLGKLAITKAVEQIECLFPNQGIRISAQLYLERFYQSFGFVTQGEMYLEDDIEHVQMLRPGTASEH